VAYYLIGVEDDGKALGLAVAEQMIEALGTLFFMARNLNAEMKILEVHNGIEGPFTRV
jgi:GTPase